MSLEERGLVVNWSTLRMAVGQGGDGDTHMKADVDNLAAFVRDPGACVTCLLLPFSGSMDLQMQVGLPGHHACRGNQRLSLEAKRHLSGPAVRCQLSLRVGCRGAPMTESRVTLRLSDLVVELMRCLRPVVWCDGHSHRAENP